jgi:hypothetical protein
MALAICLDRENALNVLQMDGSEFRIYFQIDWKT